MDDHFSGADEKGGHCSRLSRRKFLKLTAMAGLSVGAIGIHKQSNSAPSVQPGSATARGRWISTSCLNCPARCGITVKAGLHCFSSSILKRAEGGEGGRYHAGFGASLRSPLWPDPRRWASTGERFLYLSAAGIFSKGKGPCPDHTRPGGRYARGDKSHPPKRGKSDFL